MNRKAKKSRPDDSDPWAAARQRMVLEQLQGRDITDPEVCRVMGELPRHLFISPAYRNESYEDHPVPIGSDQTISQPYIQAYMTQHLTLRPDDTVLEIGTGSGYQTAILARLVRCVHTIERLDELIGPAKEVLDGLGLTHIEYHAGDGSLGWPQNAPYDAILVTAATPEVPEALIEQLSEGGRLVAPTGGQYEQILERLGKHKGRIERTLLCGCRFVKLIGEKAWPE